MIRFLHTADLQIGKPFAGFEGEGGAALRQRRLIALETLLSLAEQRRLDFVVVAGDLFDSNTVAARTVEATCSVLAKARMPVYLLPGNHDSGDADSVYRSSRFTSARPEHVQLLLTPEPCVVAEGRAVLLPAPLLRRHVLTDPARHLTAELGRDLAPHAIRIGIAHGGVTGFGGAEGDVPNILNKDLAQVADLDYLALGDWHGTRQIDARTWYSGTPEPDRFKDNSPGHVLQVDIAARGALPNVESIETAHFRWLTHQADVASAQDVERLSDWFAALPAPDRTLVELTVRGALDFATRRTLDELLATLEPKLHWLEREVDCALRPTEEELENLSGSGFLQTTVATLRARLNAGGEDGQVAGRALHLLYAMTHKTPA